MNHTKVNVNVNLLIVNLKHIFQPYHFQKISVSSYPFPYAVLKFVKRMKLVQSKFCFGSSFDASPFLEFLFIPS